MFVIGEATVDEEIAHARFSCDLVQCKGACCTLPGGRGAPLEDDELPELERALPLVKKYLTPKHLAVIEKSGFVEGIPGSYATTCVENRDCVFVYREEGIARCSLERAHLAGETTWRKPASCHLFPVRISSGKHLRYEKIPECESGRRRGRALNVPLYEFLKDALVRKFGSAWYDDFNHECRKLDDGSA